MYNLFPTSCIPIDQTKLKAVANTTSRKRKGTSTTLGESQPPTQFQYQLLKDGEKSKVVPVTKRPKSDQHAERQKWQGPGYQNSEPCCIQHNKRQPTTCITKLQGLPRSNATECAHLPMSRGKMRLQRSPTSRCLASSLSGIGSRGRWEKLSRWLLSLSLVRRRRVCRQLARSGVSKGTKRSVLQRVCPKQKHRHKRKRKIVSGKLWLVVCFVVICR